MIPGEYLSSIKTPFWFVLLIDVGGIISSKPGENVPLQPPTVLGELLDQMMLAEGFYGMGSVTEWLVSCFPANFEALLEDV